MDNFLAAILCLPFTAGPLILLAIIIAKKLQFWTVCK
jgi:hypothetical protein